MIFEYAIGLFSGWILNDNFNNYPNTEEKELQYKYMTGEKQLGSLLGNISQTQGQKILK